MNKLYAHQGCYLALPDEGYDQKSPPFVRIDRLTLEKEMLKREVCEAARLGFDGFVQLFSGLDDLVTYAAFDHPDVAYRQERVAAVASVQLEMTRTAHAQGLKYYLQNYDLMLDPWVAARIDEGNMEEILRERFREVFQQTGCDGIVVTPSEAYGRGTSCWVPLFTEKAGIAKMAELYHKIIVHEMGKELRFRLWLAAEDSGSWQTLENRLPDEVLYAVKCTAGDFWMSSPVNPALQADRNDKTLSVIFDAFHQYHGWGLLLAFDANWPRFSRVCLERGVKELQVWGSWSPSCIWPNHHDTYLNGAGAVWAGTYLENGIWESDSLMAKLNIHYLLGLMDSLPKSQAVIRSCEWEGFTNDAPILQEAMGVIETWWQEFYFPNANRRYDLLTSWATIFQMPRKTWRFVIVNHGVEAVRISNRCMQTATRVLRELRPKLADERLGRLWDRTLLFFDTHNAVRDAVLVDPAIVGNADPASSGSAAERLQALVARWRQEFPVEGRLWQITETFPSGARPVFLRPGSVSEYSAIFLDRTPSDIPEGVPWMMADWRWNAENDSTRWRGLQTTCGDN